MRVLTGIQPTNILHLGNYFGALKPAVELQREDELFIGIVDLHAITVPQEPAQLKKNIAFATAAYLAAGIDPKKAVLFQQSRVPAHAELGWLLQTIARIGELERMTQFKDKSKVKGQNVSVGLFTYPVLMAADILLYDTQAVPVGEDQKQHLELARDLAERFNRDFGQTFVVPKPIINIASGRILALDNPEIKMSKSAPSPKNYISLMDEADVIRKKIKSAVTDSEAGISVDDGRPGLKNLLSIFSLVTNGSPEDIAASYTGKGMKEVKEDLAEALITHLTPLQAAINDYLSQPDELEKIVAEGSARANEIAAKKIAEVKTKMGLSL
ncbi:MAG TPA: tryptophan--tRNA ligase [bacterium]|nr:tryptophan--tRNA ligase [bacterium]